MSKTRLEAFSDGVIAIIITIMVLELKIPHGESIEALRLLLPVFVSYAFSFIFVGIYWNNHHHLMHTVQKVSASVLWANLHLLFWLSLVPFVTGWMGEHSLDPWPVAIYGVVLVCCGFAYFVLTRALLATHDSQSPLALALGKDIKGKMSLVIYLVAIPLAFTQVWIAYALYALVALMWLVPDRRMERVLRQ
jgi:uncharacterized membrane protein